MAGKVSRAEWIAAYRAGVDQALTDGLANGTQDQGSAPKNQGDPAHAFKDPTLDSAYQAGYQSMYGSAYDAGYSGDQSQKDGVVQSAQQIDQAPESDFNTPVDDSGIPAVAPGETTTGRNSNAKPSESGTLKGPPSLPGGDPAVTSGMGPTGGGGPEGGGPYGYVPVFHKAAKGPGDPAVDPGDRQSGGGSSPKKVKPGDHY
jgi:hypothetical protein